MRKIKPKFPTLEELGVEIPYGEFRQSSNETSLKEIGNTNTNVLNYNSICAINSSSIKKIQQSPFHCDLMLAGIKTEDEDEVPKHFHFGNAFHLKVFEPEKFKKQVWTRKTSSGETAIKDYDKRKKDEKDEWEYYSQMNHGMLYVKPEEMIIIDDMYETLMEHPDINTLVSTPGHAETTYVWNTEFPYSGGSKKLNCKGRGDKVIDDICFVDLKTTKDSSEFWFIKDAFKYSYEVQAAFYLDAYQKLFGKKIEFIFVVINKTEPYFANCFKVKPSTYEKGQKAYFEKVAKYIEYKENPKSIHRMLEI